MFYRRFTPEDQHAFAQLSGDYNPLHMDPVAARRLLFGSTVVHGIHALLWALNCGLEDRLAEVEIHSIKATFPKPILVGEEVSLSVVKEDFRQIKLELSSGRSIVSVINVELSESIRGGFDNPYNRFPDKVQPRLLSDDEIEADSGILDLYLHLDEVTMMFPWLARCVSPVQIAVILNTSRLVGVYCPGMHSIYSELNFSTSPTEKTTTMNYEVAGLDRRFGMVLIKVEAPGMTGSIKAFRRPAPKVQPDYSTLKKLVDSNEFAGQQALIIGGSRGLGEVAAKLLAAGGANVKITYHQGKEDACYIVDDIVSGDGVAACLHFDVLNPGVDQQCITENNWVPTHLYYFATPFIFSAVKGIFSPELFNKFISYYVVGFINTVNQLRDLGLRSIFYPSSVAIDELPLNMGEYAASKMAGEILCTFLGKSLREIKIYKPRLPRVATDQTVSLMPVANQDATQIMLEHLRLFRNLQFED